MKGNRSRSKIAFLLVLIMVFAFFFAVPVFASAAPPVPPIPADLFSWFADLVIVQWPSLVGIAALITVLVNIGKSVGLVTDGEATRWVAGLNILGMVVLILLKIFQPQWAVLYLDSVAGVIAQVMIILSGFALQLVTSYLTHQSIRGVPVVGKSFTLDSSK